MATRYGPVFDQLTFQRRDKSGVLFSVSLQRHPDEDLIAFMDRVERSVGAVLDQSTASR